MESTPPKEEPSLATKGVWYATELFGKAAALLRKPKEMVSAEAVGAPSTIEEAAERLLADYAGTSDDPRPYFLTGRMDALLYDEDCEFSDPFVSFNGRQRFQDNLQNLAGGFIIDSSVRMLESSLDEGDPANDVPPTYTTKLLVKLQLGLPWKPVLAWPWGVEHVFDPESTLIVKHIERWNVGPSEGVRQLLTAGPPDGLRQGRTSESKAVASSADSAARLEADEDAASLSQTLEASGTSGASPLGTMDPVAGPLVRLGRKLKLLPNEEGDGWTGEPSAWAEADSLPQKLSSFTQKRLGGFKQWTAEFVAGNFDADEADAKLDEFISSSPVVMFSFTSCPFCKKAKEELDAQGVSYRAIELDELSEGAALRARLGARTSRTSVPSIWIGGDCIGGLNDGSPGLMPLLESGELDLRVQAASAA